MRDGTSRSQNRASEERRPLSISIYFSRILSLADFDSRILCFVFYRVNISGQYGVDNLLVEAERVSESNTASQKDCHVTFSYNQLNKYLILSLIK